MSTEMWSVKRIGRPICAGISAFIFVCCDAQAGHVHHQTLAEHRAAKVHRQDKTFAEHPAADLRKYDRLVALRDQNVALFDRIHPLIGRVLGSERFYEKELWKLETHPGCLHINWPCLTSVLEGSMIHRQSLSQIPTSGQILPPPLSEGSVAVPPSQSGAAPSGDTGQSGAAVPEPSFAILVISGVLGGLVFSGRRLIMGATSG